MAELTDIGARNTLLKYTDDNSVVIRIAIPHIVDFMDAGNSMLKIETTTGGIKIKLDDQAAVNAAIALLEAKF